MSSLPKKSLRCKLGLHRYRTAYYYDNLDACSVRVDETRGVDGLHSQCIDCKKEVAVIGQVIRSAEGHGIRPIFRCTCDKGNQWHEQEWDKEVDRVIDRVKRMKNARSNVSSTSNPALPAKKKNNP